MQQRHKKSIAAGGKTKKGRKEERKQNESSVTSFNLKRANVCTVYRYIAVSSHIPEFAWRLALELVESEEVSPSDAPASRPEEFSPSTVPVLNRALPAEEAAAISPIAAAVDAVAAG